MEIRESSRAELKDLVIAVTLLLALLLSPGSISASQLILNGSFKDNLKHWQPNDVTKGVRMTWDAAGHSGPGSIRFKAAGHRVRGEMYATQLVGTQITPGSSGKIEFAWKKNWSAISPQEQSIYVKLVKPDKSITTIWMSKQPSNNNEWVEESVDISRFLDQSGQYSIRLGAAFANGSANAAATEAWFDAIRLDVSADLNSRPETSLANPAGSDRLTGKSYLIGGIASDTVGVAKVEVAIVRLKDNAYWNGSSWVKNAYWNRAAITSGRGDRMAMWSYVWSLPTSDGANFKIMARSVTITDNIETFPTESTVQVDNVGPIGTISIENAAKYTNSKQARIDVDIKGATWMRFSPDDGASWTKWERFTTVKVLSIPAGDGTKIVSAQFRDDSKNYYQTSDSIVLDTVPPVTKHVFPAANAGKVSPNSSVGIVFYEGMDPLSFKNDGTEQGSTLYIKQGSRWIAADVSYDEKAKTAKLVPKSTLDTGARYSVYLNSGIKDAAGNPLAANFSWSFTTTGSYKSSFKGIIGEAGGTLEDANQGISLEVLPGAFTANTNVTVEELRGDTVPPMKGLTRYSPVYRMLPDQLPFGVPAILRIKYKPDEVPNPTELRFVAYDSQSHKWLPVPNSRIDLVNNLIIAPLSQLTTVAITAQDDASTPSTTIMSPTGTIELIGRTCNIFGLSTDNSRISAVELAITRLSDHAYWDGRGWGASEAWIKAKIIARKEKTSATWSYAWPLPDNRFSGYQIKVRATDNGGNIETGPNLVQVRLAKD